MALFFNYVASPALGGGGHGDAVYSTIPSLCPEWPLYSDVEGQDRRSSFDSNYI